MVANIKFSQQFNTLFFIQNLVNCLKTYSNVQLMLHSYRKAWCSSHKILIKIHSKFHLLRILIPLRSTTQWSKKFRLEIYEMIFLINRSLKLAIWNIIYDLAATLVNCLKHIFCCSAQASLHPLSMVRCSSHV